MKIRAPKHTVKSILEAIQNGEFSVELQNKHHIHYELEEAETYKEFKSRDGKAAQLPKADWNILSSYVIA